MCFNPDHPLYQALKKFAEIRQSNPALRSGVQVHRYSSESPGIYAFSRIDPKSREEYVLAFNNDTKAHQATFKTYASGSFTPLYPAGSPAVVAKDALTLEVPPLDFVILKADQPIPPSAAPAVRFTSPASNGVLMKDQFISVDLSQDVLAEVRFEAKVGEVMTFEFVATGFAQKVIVRNPNLEEVLRADAMPDQSNVPWSMITETPGRYLVAISSLGDGGGGEYTLSRKVYAPTEFGKGKPAAGNFADGQTQVWKFSARPDEPLFIHWTGTGAYGASVRDETGAPVGIGLTRVDDRNEFGILKVSRPTTFLIVLTPGDKKGSFSIELSDLPGYPKNR